MPSNKRTIINQRRYKTKRYFLSASQTKIGQKLNKTSAEKKFGPFKLLLLIAFVTLLTYFFFFSEFFMVSNVNISGTKIENTILIEKIKNNSSFIKGKNIFFLDTQTVETQIRNSFPELENVTVKKDLPNSVIIDFKEHPLVANIVNISSTIKKSYIINAAGFAIKEDYENPNLPYIKIQTDEPLNTDQSLVQQSRLKYMLDSKTNFEEKFGMKILEIEYLKNAREIHLITEKNFEIWLDIERSYEEQFKKLKKALVKLNIYTEPLLYIDLRIAGVSGDKIIYKRKS